MNQSGNSAIQFINWRTPFAHAFALFFSFQPSIQPEFGPATTIIQAGHSSSFINFITHLVDSFLVDLCSFNCELPAISGLSKHLSFFASVYFSARNAGLPASQPQLINPGAANQRGICIPEPKTNVASGLLGLINSGFISEIN